jgi:hypothetical protein
VTLFATMFMIEKKKVRTKVFGRLLEGGHEGFWEEGEAGYEAGAKGHKEDEV